MDSIIERIEYVRRPHSTRTGRLSYDQIGGHPSGNGLFDPSPSSQRAYHFAYKGCGSFPATTFESQSDLYEIGREQLSFKEEEIKQLFSIMGAGILTETEMDELNQLTEGWVAALCVIASQASSTPGLKYPYAINLSLLQVFDYLNEELLLTMDSEVQTFLLHTSIVDRMCPELCNELTGRNDSRTLLARWNAPMPLSH